MAKIILYHGTSDKEVVPCYGKGKDMQDYGNGFYLTEDLSLAKEWAVNSPNNQDGYVHKFELETENLKILDFHEKGVLPWLAELMKHRDADESKRYKVLSDKFIKKYGIETDGYDIIKGWRANVSSFFIVREFVRDNVDIDILEELLSLGGLGVQYCIKSKLAYTRLQEVENSLINVPYIEFNHIYNERDIKARHNMRELINSDKNKVTNVFSTLFKE